MSRKHGMNAFEFAALPGLRAAQLGRGCTPRAPHSHTVAVTAQHEIAQRTVVRVVAAPEGGPEPA